MKRAIKTHSTDFIAILVLVVLAIAVSAYILGHQGFRFPLITSAPFSDYVEMQTGQAITPGQGQSVRVSGVQIGDIGGIKLQNGTALVRLDIDQKYRHLIHADATALLRPRTGLDDMFIELDPGRAPSPVAKPGFVIQMSDSLPDIDPDEVLAELDADTRAYLGQLINGAGLGLKNRGDELAQLFEKFEPTHRDLARVNSAVAERGADLQQLVDSLARLNEALAQKQSQIVGLVGASETVFHAFASEDNHVSQAIADLPGTLAQTTSTLEKVETFADQLGPATKSLLPAANALPAANRALRRLAVPSTPIVKNQIRPFVVAAQPTVRNLRPAAIKLAAATPNLATSFHVVNSLVNLLGYNPGNAVHGYLFWLAWADHNARSLFANQDANGDFRNLFIQLSCASLEQISDTTPLADVVGNLTPILSDAKLCPKSSAAISSMYAKYEDSKLPATETMSNLAESKAKSTPFLPRFPEN